MKKSMLILGFSMAIIGSLCAQANVREPIDFPRQLIAADAVVVASLKLLDSERLSDDKNSFIHEDRYVIRIKERIKGEVANDSLLLLPTHREGEPNPVVKEGKMYLLFLQKSEVSVPFLVENSAASYSLLGGWRGLIPTTADGSDNRIIGLAYKVFNIDLIKDNEAFLEVIRATAQQKPLSSLSERGKHVASALGFE